MEGVDYVIEAAPLIRGAGNRGAKDEYHLTLDMAKELAMVENNEEGRRVRRYFICDVIEVPIPVLTAAYGETRRTCAPRARRK